MTGWERESPGLQTFLQLLASRAAWEAGPLGSASAVAESFCLEASEMFLLSWEFGNVQQAVPSSVAICFRAQQAHVTAAEGPLSSQVFLSDPALYFLSYGCHPRHLSFNLI